MTHCTMDDLVALRAGEGTAWARAHVDGCAGCRAELDALHQRVARLRALPVRRSPRDRWPAVRAAILAGRRRRERVRWWSLAAAAAAVAAVLVFRPFGGEPAGAAELSRAKRESATLERALARYDPDGRVTSGRSAALAALLEDRIAAIDAELARLGTAGAPARPAELVDLWRQRVGLMQQLVRVRVTRAAYTGL
jgi:hypothetical protein